jgi:hypothetical protein
MKPYLLIAGDQYYPSSRTGDWIACFDTYEEAKEEVIDDDEMVSIRGANYDWYEIVDLRNWMQ